MQRLLLRILFFTLSTASMLAWAQSKNPAVDPPRQDAPQPQRPPLPPDTVIGQPFRESDTSWVIYPFLYISGGKYIDTQVPYDTPSQTVRPTKLDRWLSQEIATHKEYTLYDDDQPIGTFHVDGFTSNPLHSAQIMARGRVEPQTPNLKPTDLPHHIIAISPALAPTTGSLDIDEDFYRHDVMKQSRKMLENASAGEAVIKIESQKAEYKYFRLDDLGNTTSRFAISVIEQPTTVTISSPVFPNPNHVQSFLFQQFSVIQYTDRQPKVLFECHKRLELDTSRVPFIRSVHVLDLDGDGRKEILLCWGQHGEAREEVYKLEVKDEWTLARIFKSKERGFGD